MQWTWWHGPRMHWAGGMDMLVGLGLLRGSGDWGHNSGSAWDRPSRSIFGGVGIVCAAWIRWVGD